MTLAGAVRDCDIALKLVARSKAQDAATVEARLRSRRAEAEKTLAVSLRRWTSEGAASKWRQALQAESPEHESQPATVEAVARRMLPRLAEVFFREGRRAAARGASAEQLHKFRLASKRFRYTLELFAEFYGPAAAHWVEQLRATQTFLGGISDCAVTRRLVQDLGASAAMVAALKDRQKRKAREFRKAWWEGLGSAGVSRRWVQSLHRPARKPPARAAGQARLVIRQHA